MADFNALKAKVDFSEVEDARKAFSDLKNEIPGATDATDMFDKAVRALENPLLAVGAAIAAGIAGAITLGNQSIEAADAIGKLAIRTGESVEMMQAMSDVADMSGTNIETLIAVLSDVTKKSMSAGEEGKKVAGAYEYLGVSARDAAGNLKDAKVLVAEGWEAYEKMGKSADAAAAFIDGFGASALKAGPAVKELSTQIDTQRQFLEDHGALMDGALVEAATKFNDSMSNLRQVFAGFGNDIARDHLPLLQGFSEAMIQSSEDGGILNIAMGIIRQTMVLVGGAVKVVLTAFMLLDLGVKVVIGSIKMLGDMMEAVVNGDWGRIGSIWDKGLQKMTDSSVAAQKSILDLWTTMDKAPESVKNPSLENPYARATKPAKVKVAKGKKEKAERVEPAKGANITNELISQEKALIALRNAYTGLYGAEQETKVQQLEAAITLGKYNSLIEVRNGKTVQLTETEREAAIAKMRANASDEDALTIINKLAAARIAATEATDNAIKSSKDALAVARIQVSVMTTYGKTQDDVNMAIAEYRAQQAELAVAEGILNGLSEEKLIKLREELRLMRERISIASDTKEMNDSETARQSTFAYGWESSFKKYQTDAANAAGAADKVFNSVSSNMESAIEKFAMTGKLSFADFTRSILADLAKIAAKKAVSGILGMITGAVGSYFGGGDDLGGAFADGGDPPVGKVSLVGERGPELFIPKTAGTIIPNSALGLASSSAPTQQAAPQYNISVSIGSVDSDDRQALLMQQLRATMVQVSMQTMRDQMRDGGQLAGMRR